MRELKIKIGYSTIIDGNFNNSVSVMDRTTKQKISKDIKDLKDIIN